MTNSEQTLRRLYEALGEDYFAYDLKNVAYDEPDYDATIGMQRLHRVCPVVEPERRAPSIPPEVFAKYAETSFWMNPSMNHRGVQIL